MLSYKRQYFKMETKEVLQEIGLTKNESEIYLALLKLGTSLVSNVVKETNLNRTYVYDRLDKLIQKGVVSYKIQSGKKYFQAISPNKLLEQLKEKEENFKGILPQLLSMTKEKEKINIEIYKGKEGLKSLLQDILKEKKEIYVLGFTGSVAKNLEFFYPHFQNKRIKLGIKRKMLVDYQLKTSKMLKEKLTKCKILPKEYQNPSGTWIYGNKTVIFIPSEELYMVFLESKKVSQQYRNYFDLLWKTAKM